MAKRGYNRWLLKIQIDGFDAGQGMKAITIH
jgi:hypothetical protein